MGVREALKSNEMVNFMKENEHVSLEVHVRRNYHPYVSSTYINGYVKD